MWVGPDGQSIPQVLISLTQTVTILAERQKFELYRASKSVDNASTREANLRISRRSRERPAAGALLVPDSSRPFAALHQLSRAL